MSGDRKKAAATPITGRLEAGKSYEWCNCGMSEARPFCDHSQPGDGCQPVSFVAKNSEEALLCGCGQSDDPPYCDGTHNVI